VARARRPALRRGARRARCRRDSTSRPAARVRTLPVELTPHYFSLPRRPSLPHFSVARIETDAPTLPPPPAYPATLLPLPTLLPEPRRLPRHIQSLGPPRPRSVGYSHLSPRAPVEAPASTGPCHRTLEPRRRRSPGIRTLLACSAAGASNFRPLPPSPWPLFAPPPCPLPLAHLARASQNRIIEGPFARFPQARRSFDRGSNPSRSCMSRSNPPALARGTASGRTRGRHMAPTHTVCRPGPIRGPGQ
jgi:hypothetical protein